MELDGSNNLKEQSDFSFVENNLKHTEDIIIYRMLSKKQIALCQIKKVQFYKTKKDFYFRSHHIYGFISSHDI